MPAFHFTFEPAWRDAPLAYWVHLNLTSVETPAFRPERREFPGLKAGVSRSGLGGDSNPFQALFGSSGLKA